MKTNTKLLSGLLTGIAILILGACGSPEAPKSTEAEKAPAMAAMPASTPNCFASEGDFTFEMYTGSDNSHVNIYVTAYFPDMCTSITSTPISITKTGSQYVIDLNTTTASDPVWETELLIQSVPVTLSDPFAEGDTFLVKLKGREATKPVRSRMHL